MIFTPIDFGRYPRAEHFGIYFNENPCVFEITKRLDVTALRNAKVPFFPAMIHSITAVVNNHSEFRTSKDGNGVIGYFDSINPLYTVFHKDSETFSSIWTQYDENFEIFCAEYEKDIAKYAQDRSFCPKQAVENTFHISMLPWTDFSSFHLQIQKRYDYLLPIFTLGQFQNENNKYTVPLSIQVHHAVCDGFHAARFLNELQHRLNEF